MHKMIFNFKGVDRVIIGDEDTLKLLQEKIRIGDIEEANSELPSDETKCLEDRYSIQCCNCTFVQRNKTSDGIVMDNSVVVLLANGGQVSLNSLTPIVATIRPEE